MASSRPAPRRCSHLCLGASGNPAGKRAVLLAAAGGTGGALLAAVSKSAGGLAALLPVLQAVIFVAPIFFAVRLYRNGNRRAALRLALTVAARRFCTRWWQYATIPLFAGAVGWVTNKLAVDMIFYPIEFAGLRLRTYPNQPLGWVGWQGIVPAKAAMMAQRLTAIITEQLIDVRKVFGRLEPDKVASLMAPGVNNIAEQVAAL